MLFALWFHLRRVRPSLDCASPKQRAVVDVTCTLRRCALGSWHKASADMVDQVIFLIYYQTLSRCVCSPFRPLSQQETMPAVSINAKHASSWSKVYISKDHAVKARDTPGEILKQKTNAIPSGQTFCDCHVVLIVISDSGYLIQKQCLHPIGDRSGKLSSTIAEGRWKCPIWNICQA